MARLPVHRILVVATLLVLLASSPAGGEPREPAPASDAKVTEATAVDLKMDAALRMTVERYRDAAALAKAGQGPAPGPALLHPGLPFGLEWNGPAREPQVSVFAKLSHPDAVAALTAAGARILFQDRDLVTARIPVSRVAEAAGSPGVLSMSISKRWYSQLDSSRIRSRVKDVHLGAGTLPQAYLGDGVIVGVLDSGIDYTHDDFRNSADDSRLLGLFDFSQGTDGEACRPGQLDSLTCPEIDGSGSHGHGTHVTGIAAGNGRLNPQYLGMAPNADLLFVKGIRDAQSNGGFSDIDVINGCAWMLNQALTQGKPIAINLSLGGQLGAHDGTSLQEQNLDRFSGPGRIIVAAAGNAGGETIHCPYAPAGTIIQTRLETGLALGVPLGVVDLWAPSGSNLKVGLIAYNNSLTPLFVSNAASPGQLVQQIATNPGGPACGQITIDARTTSDPNNGAMNGFIEIEKATGESDPTNFFCSVYTSAPATFDMWVVTPGIFFPSGLSVPPNFRAGDDNMTVAIPGTGKRIVCVGSHVTKTQWIDVNGQVQTQPGATLDAISGFSSHGPSRDGRTLPNLTAPGEAIISVLSKDFTPDSPLIALGGGYQEQQGTSQASPHITGIAALMLERDPALTPENVRSILQQTATPTGGNPNNIFGAGRVQALAALQATPDPLNCTVVLPSGRQVPCEELAGEPMSLMAYPNPATEGVRLSFTVPTRSFVDLAVYDLMGRRLKTLRSEDMAPGVYAPAWNGDDERGRRVPGGIYFARLTMPGGTRTIRLMVRR